MYSGDGSKSMYRAVKEVYSNGLHLLKLCGNILRIPKYKYLFYLIIMIKDLKETCGLTSPPAPPYHHRGNFENKSLKTYKLDEDNISNTVIQICANIVKFVASQIIQYYIII